MTADDLPAGRDAETLAFYDREAAAYADWTRGHGVPTRLKQLAQARPGARVLDLGCGAGWASLWMAEAGLRVTAMDPSRGLLEHLREAPVEVVCGGALELEAEEAFDAVWSNCALQHLPRGDMPNALNRVARALVPGGAFLLSIHEGEETLRDRIGRLYNHWTEAGLTRLMGERGLQVARVSRAEDTGYDGRPITILQLDADKRSAHA